MIASQKSINSHNNRNDTHFYTRACEERYEGKVDEMLSLYPIIYYDIAFSSAFIRNFLALFMTFFPPSVIQKKLFIALALLRQVLFLTFMW